MSFVHLHTHTAYSLLDGQGRIPNLVKRAKELGQNALAVTDHGNMYGVIDFYECARENGIKPVIGCEVYVAARTRFDKLYETDSQSCHLILLAENNTGYHNLMKIVSAGFTEGYYYRPRTDMQLLREYNEGIIALSACMSGVISRQLLSGNYEEAKRKAEEFLEIFGRDRYFIELQDHGIFEQKKLNRDLLRLASELDIQVVATNDVHYVNESDAEYQDVLMCIQTGKTLDDPERMKMNTTELYLKSEEEMNRLFSYVPQALENTQKIADRCNVDIEFGKLHLPQFALPEGYTACGYLKKLVRDGMKERYPNDNGAVSERMNYELEIIEKMGYVDYFLIVWDFIRYAKSRNIPVGPGRGSAAGSVVAYCLHITDVDPLKYNLIFERFLNPERVSMPDIDIDFCYVRRGEVIDYVNRKYGADNVAQIVTFGTMAARLAIRDVGRVLNIPYGVVDEVAKQVPQELKMTIKTALEVNYKLKELYDSSADIKRLIDTAIELEGLPRHTSTHAAGVVITSGCIDNFVPLQKNDDVITTQFTMTTIERLGLLKMDFLGLRTLTVIQNATEHILATRGTAVDIEEIDMSDKAVYDMISRGETDGVFQLESAGMKQFMKELKPSSIEDIIAGISLYRPGPMDSIPRYIANKNNPQLIKYKHPMLEHILNMTYGCIVYQEQVMQIVRELGGYSLGRADLVRRAMSKKKADVMEKERKNFIFGTDEGGVHVDGAVARGIDEKIAASVFDEMMDFASYAFNKSHAAAYAVVAYRTAWLKCHYPAEFFAALITSFADNASKVTKYIDVAKRMGIKMLPPSINKSGREFSVDGDCLRFGLEAVKNVGGAMVDEIAAERKSGGDFCGLVNFCRRMADKKINKRVVESLIKCGAFDEFGSNRAQMYIAYEHVMDDAQTMLKTTMPGQFDMFSDMTEDVKKDEDNFDSCPEFPQNEILAMEKESIGMYVSGHPLDGYAEAIRASSTAYIAEIVDNEDKRFNIGSQVTVSGIITKTRNQITKKGDMMRYVEIEDLSGTLEVIVFPSQLKRYDSILKEGTCVTLAGNLDISEEAPPKLRLEAAGMLDPNIKKPAKLYLRVTSADDSKLHEVKRVLKDANGNTAVVIKYSDTGQLVSAPKSMMIKKDDGRVEKLIKLLGEENVKLVEK